MRSRLVLVGLTLAAAACTGGGDTTTSSTAPPPQDTTTTTVPPTSTTPPPPTTTTTSVPEITSSFAIVGLTFDERSPSVVIRNVGDAIVDLGGHWLAKGSAFFEIPPVPVPPGGVVAVSLGGEVLLAVPEALTVAAVADLGPIDPGSGEIALYRSADVGNVADVVDYVAWGAPGQPLAAHAVEAGVWAEGEAVETSADTIGMAVISAPAEHPENWTVIDG